MKYTHAHHHILGAIFASCCTLQAATITWAPSQNLFQGSTTETFVSTNGALAVAYNATSTATGGDVTVNGVNFIGTETTNTLTGTSGESITIDGGGNNQGAFGDGQFSSNIPIFNLLSGGSFNIPTVTLGGLTIGNTYEIQIISHDGRGSRNNALVGFSNGVDQTAVAVSGDLNNTGSPEPDAGGTGDFFIGTFTADTASQTFTVFGEGDSADGINFASGNSQSAINAIQLRTIATIPEPSSSLLLGLAGTALLLRRRK